jgi:hypothetical protein
MNFRDILIARTHRVILSLMPRKNTVDPKGTCASGRFLNRRSIIGRAGKNRNVE